MLSDRGSHQSVQLPAAPVLRLSQCGRPDSQVALPIRRTIVTILTEPITGTVIKADSRRLSLPQTQGDGLDGEILQGHHEQLSTCSYRFARAVSHGDGPDTGLATSRGGRVQLKDKERAMGRTLYGRAGQQDWDSPSRRAGNYCVRAQGRVLRPVG